MGAVSEDDSRQNITEYSTWSPKTQRQSTWQVPLRLGPRENDSPEGPSAQITGLGPKHYILNSFRKRKLQHLGTWTLRDYIVPY